ncbi:hypothetical protein DSO57_1014161 [Entomophthora muscae]|uniref:Uncharacterized protein n=1 Tax=Entomophthora muscae TaxID=34485 RepID=A0ACC2TSZ0_9FUNG|nr:hypothetical protein DSO57_1014161 [Entomophthora muscae]
METKSQTDFTKEQNNSKVPTCVTRHVNSLPPLALDQSVFPRRTKKGPKIAAQPLNSLDNLAHTVDERFVLTYPAGPPASVVPSWEETLINLDYLLAWCCPLLKTIRDTQLKDATPITTKLIESEICEMFSNQSDAPAKINLKLYFPHGSNLKILCTTQSDSIPAVM